MKRMLWMLVAVLLTACSAGGGQSNARAVAESRVAARAADPECDGSRDAFIAADGIGPARRLGSTRVRARTVNDPRYFATDCDVPLTLRRPHHPDCVVGGGAPIGFNGAWLSIDRKEAGKFTMNVAWPADPAKDFTVEMQAGRDGSDVSGGPTDYLVGKRGTGIDERKYFVHFDNTLGESTAGVRQLWKTYWIQVYVKGPGGTDYLCSDHMPDHSAQDDEESNSSKVYGHTKQAGTGGGIEPARRP
jgi:hypothetical protein